MACRKLNDIEQRLVELSRIKIGERMATVTNLKCPLTFDEEITLLGMLDDPSFAIRHEATEKLFDNGGRWARFAVRYQLANREELYTDEHLEMLGVVGTKRDVTIAERYINDPYWVIRCSVACCLGDLGDKRARTLLKVMIVNDPHSTVRCWAYEGVIATRRDGKEEDIHQFLTTQYEKESGTARIELLHGLYQFGERERLTEIFQFCLQEDSTHIPKIRVFRGLLECVHPEDIPFVLETSRPYITLCTPASVRELAQELVEKLESKSIASRL